MRSIFSHHSQYQDLVSLFDPTSTISGTPNIERGGGREREDPNVVQMEKRKQEKFLRPLYPHKITQDHCKH